MAPCWARGRAGRWPAMFGYGYFLGISVTLALFWLLQKLSSQWQPEVVLGLLALLLLVAAFVFRRSLRPEAGPFRALSALAQRWRLASLGARLMVVLALSLLALWAALVGSENILRPVFPWDAWETWSYVAKTVSAYPEALHERRMQMRFEQSMVPLLQVWQARALGEWQGGFVNLPWLAAGCALLLALYGQLRYAGACLGGALTAVLILAFTPLFAVNVALGGYPELWTCSFYALAVMAACLAVAERQWQQAVLFLAASILLVFTDRYAAGFSVVLWLVVLGVLLPPRHAFLVLSGILVGVVVWAVTTGIDLNLPKLGRLVVSREEIRVPKALAMSFSMAEAPWADAAVRLFLDATWGLLWPLMIATIALSLYHWRDRALRLLLMVVVPTVLLIMVMMLFSRLQATVVEGTGINRWLFPLLPVMIFWCGLLFARPIRGSVQNLGQA